jgi:hypothetical protein
MQFQSRNFFKDYVQSLQPPPAPPISLEISKPAPTLRKWSDRVGVRDVQHWRAGIGRDRRSAFLEIRNTTHPLQCQSTTVFTYLNDSTRGFSYPCSSPYLASSASRPESWINLISSTISRQVMASIVLLDPLFDFVTVSLLSDVPIKSSRPQFQQDQVVDLSPQLGVPPTAYRNVSAGNCYSHSTDTLVCYGHHGRTTLFAQSPSDDESPPPLRQDQNTFRDCRSIEWHGRPSVT